MDSVLFIPAGFHISCVHAYGRSESTNFTAMRGVSRHHLSFLFELSHSVVCWRRIFSGNVNYFLQYGVCSNSTTDPDTPYVQFSVAYDQSRSTLIVTVATIVNLPAGAAGKHRRQQQQQLHQERRGGSRRLDPYVRLGLHLADGRRFKAKTRVVRTATSSSPRVPPGTGHAMQLQDQGTTAAGEAEFGETFAFRGVDVVQLFGVATTSSRDGDAMTSSMIEPAKLHLAALAFDRFSRDSVIGEAYISLDEPGQMAVVYCAVRTWRLI